jgi:hypothetical protein
MEWLRSFGSVGRFNQGKILYMPYDISSFYTLLRAAADAASKYFLMSY